MRFPTKLLLFSGVCFQTAWVRSICGKRVGIHPAWDMTNGKCKHEIVHELQQTIPSPELELEQPKNSC